MNELPLEFKKYFWDCDYSSLDFKIHKEYVIKRLLSFGDFEEIKFILKNISQQEIKVLINSKGSNLLSKNNYIFWKKISDHEELWG